MISDANHANTLNFMITTKHDLPQVETQSMQYCFANIVGYCPSLPRFLHEILEDVVLTRFIVSDCLLLKQFSGQSYQQQGSCKIDRKGHYKPLVPVDRGSFRLLSQ
jgi:hypothetical protein